jgi:hypothetical protein
VDAPAPCGAHTLCGFCCFDLHAPCPCSEQADRARQSEARECHYPTARGHQHHDHAQYSDQRVIRRSQGASPPEAIGWLVNAVKVSYVPSLSRPHRAPLARESIRCFAAILTSLTACEPQDMPQKWFKLDDAHGGSGVSRDSYDGPGRSLFSTWAGVGDASSSARSSSAWKFPVQDEARKSLSPPAYSPMSDDRVASEADTVSETRTHSLGASAPPESPSMYFQSKAPLPPARGQSTDREKPSTPPLKWTSPPVVPSLYATNNWTTSTLSVWQDTSYSASNWTPPATDTNSKEAACASCGSRDSFAKGGCQICGHVNPAMSGRTPSANAYSYSYAGRTCSTYSTNSSASYSAKLSNCPECKACDSMNQGCCEMCGYSRPALSRLPVLATPISSTTRISGRQGARGAHMQTPAHACCARGNATKIARTVEPHILTSKHLAGQEQASVGAVRASQE